MRIRLIAAGMLVALLLVVAVAPVAAMDGDTCSHDMSTVPSLYHCVHHALNMGHISNAGVATSLLAKLDAAQAAVERGQADVAANILNALINEVQAQSGIHIDPMHADHIIRHVQMVIGHL